MVGTTYSDDFPVKDAIQGTFAGGNLTDGFDLRLMSSVNDVSNMPTDGKNLIIVADVQNVLHFRIFDADGKRVVDTGENQLPDKAPQIAELKSLLSDLWGVPQLSQSDKDRVITAVTSIVGHTLSDAFLTKLSTAGSRLVYSTFLGGGGYEDAYAIALDQAGSAYVAGDTSSTDFPTARPIQAGLAGPGDAFVAKIGAPLPSIDVRSPADGSPFLAGSTVLVNGYGSAPVDVNGTPVEVMDPAGNFFTRVLVSPGQNTYQFVATDVYGQKASATLTLQGVQPPAGPIDFSLFSDVSASFTGDYARTSFNEDTKILYADLRVRNVGQYPADAPLIVGVKNISDPTVRAVGFDGVMPDGTPYFDFTSLMAGNTLAPGGTTDYQSLEFLDPNRVQFTYDLVFLGKLNHAPAITSVPVVDAIAGRSYSYAASATDPDSDPLTFSLTTAPSAMQVDPASGQVTWSPTTDDLGTHNITLRLDDGRGGYATQTYVINVTTPPPNRPPYFTSVPVVDANVNTAYAYQATAVDPDGDPLTFAVATGPDALQVDAKSGLVSWTPTYQQLGPQNVSLTVADGQGGTATQSYTILVQQQPGNHPPVIISPPVTTAVAGQAYTYPVKAVDPDDDPLTYSLTTAPQGMSIDSNTGLINWNVPLTWYTRQITSIDTTSLPSLQGWTFVTGTGRPESSLVSVRDKTLVLNTMGTGFRPTEAYSAYIRSDFLDLNFSYTIEMRLRVLQTEGKDTNFGLELTSGPHAYTLVGIGTHSISADGGNSISSGFDGTVFHDYRFEFDPTKGLSLFVDGKFATASPWSYSGASLDYQIYWGDFTMDGNNLTEVSSFTIMQDIPTSTPPPDQPITVRVDDGRGGFDTQSYTLNVSSAAPAEIHGTNFNDMNGDGVRSSTATVDVPGTADPWLAGMPSGATASGGDVAPTQSPVLVSALTVSAGARLSFSATGGTSLDSHGGGIT